MGKGKITVSVYLDFIRSLWSKFDKNLKMPRETFEKHIGNRFGTDPRTIYKHRRNMGKYGIIRNGSLFVTISDDTYKIIQGELSKELTEQAQEAS